MAPTPVSLLFERLDAATESADVSSVCEAVKQTLIDQITTGDGLELPAEYCRTCPDSYARRLLHKTDRYAIVVMVWGSGQGTPIHDHDDKWCVECVYSGRIQVHSYDLIGEPTDEVVSFRVADKVEASRGAAGSLIPPFDYHVIENRGSETAITIHVYGGEMSRCHAYTELGDGRFQRQDTSLSYTP